MNNFLHHLEIRNFKSIRHLRLDCNRVNIVIGKPNTGKSNLLEAIGMLGYNHVTNYAPYLSAAVRHEDMSNLFFDNDVENEVFVGSGREETHLRFSNTHYELITATRELVNLIDVPDRHQQEVQDRIENLILDRRAAGENINAIWQFFDKAGRLQSSHLLKYDTLSAVRKYDLKKLERHHHPFRDFLVPPHGDNLFSILRTNKNLYQQLVPLFNEYNLELVLRMQESKIEVQKKADGIIYSYPYSTLSDTVQRMIFYSAAIESNRDAMLVFDQPEACLFPLWSLHLAEKMAADIHNQYFISIQNPYFLQKMVQQLKEEEVHIFITYFESHQTIVRQISREAVKDIANGSVEVFF